MSRYKDGDKFVRLQFKPNPQVLSGRDTPINGQMVIQYDLERDYDAGDLKVFKQF